MSEQRWTAPQDGYYRFGHSPEPEYLGTEPPASATTDPRIGALLSLTQGLIAKYGELASSVAQYLPEQAKAELVDHAQTLMQDARSAYAEIEAMTVVTVKL